MLKPPKKKPLPFPHPDLIEMDGISGYPTYSGCGKEIAGRVQVFWSRPSTAHFFSRLYIYCPDCVARLRADGIRDGFLGILPVPAPCGTRVLGHWSENDGALHFDYMPIESPRLFGLHARGGEMLKRLEQFGFNR